MSAAEDCSRVSAAFSSRPLKLPTKRVMWCNSHAAGSPTKICASATRYSN